MKYFVYFSKVAFRKHTKSIGNERTDKLNPSFFFAVVVYVLDILKVDIDLILTFF